MKKILIADDNKEFCITLKNIMEELEYDIYFAHGGKETLRRIYTVSPDLLILDINIPEVTSHEICQIIRQDKFYKDLPIIAINENTQEELRENKNLDVNEIMTSPLDMEDFLQKIENILTE